MTCPFGFPGPKKAQESDCDGDVDSVASEDDVRGGPKLAKQSDGSAGPPAEGDGRFDYDKDPVSWFFQNQIKSEEEFQARKAQLRAAARQRLDDMFEKKGKRLLVNSEDDDFSICSSELSAWDSDVESISSLADCAREWREGAHFCAPGEAMLQLALVTAVAAAAHCCWRSLQALLAVNRYWGILKHGWAPMASFVTAAVMTAAAACCWLLMGRSRKRTMLGFQVGLQLLYVVTAGLTLSTYSFPAEIDFDLKASACVPRSGGMDPASSRLCQYLPAIDDEVRAHMSAIFGGCAAEAAACAACLVLSSWYLWELSYVEKKALKVKRRRHHRKNRIPWEKIKVENLGPVTSCGGGGGAAAGARKAAGGGGGCPFGKMAGVAPAGKKTN